MKSILEKVPLIGLVSSMVVILLSLIAQLTGTYELVAHTDPFLFREDKVSMYEDRFADVKPFLSGHDQIGYISDSEESEEFLLTQYVIAPVFLIDRADCCSLVLGHFLNPAYDGHTELEYLRPVQEFSGNVILFEYIGD